MNLVDVLLMKFPDINLIEDLKLVNRGQGIIIETWNYKDIPHPTQQVLDQWALEVSDQYELQEVLKARKLDYIKEGATTDALIIALWEKIMENRPEAANILESKRQTVKNKHPKPQ